MTRIVIFRVVLFMTEAEMGIFDWLFGDTDDEEAELDDMILMDMDDEEE